MASAFRVRKQKRATVQNKGAFVDMNQLQRMLLQIEPYLHMPELSNIMVSIDGTLPRSKKLTEDAVQRAKLAEAAIYRAKISTKPRGM